MFVINVIRMEGRGRSGALILKAIDCLLPSEAYVNKYIVSIGDLEKMSTWVFSSDVAHAKVFPDPLSAIAFCKQQSANVPLRPDGEPNRPLAIFTVRIGTKHAISAAVGTGAMKCSMK